MKQKFFWWTKRIIAALAALTIIANTWIMCEFVIMSKYKMLVYQLLPLVMAIITFAWTVNVLKEEKEKTDE